MFISGISVEKKNPLQFTMKTKKKTEERPYSSEHKLYELQAKLNPSKRKQQIQPQSKHRSQNKIIFKQTQSSNNTNNLPKKEVGNPRKVYEPKRKSQNLKNQQNNKTKNSKLDPLEEMKITSYFRYYPISILSVCGVKDQFMKLLAQQSEFRPLTPFKKPNCKKDISGFWKKISKLAYLKSKYKYRQRFNYAYSSQLKALEYKRREWKKKKQSSSESSDDDDRKQKCRDMETWKRSMGVDGKVFIIKGKYPDLRQALIQRGWVQNEDKKSSFFDLKWTTKVSDINYDTVKPNQMVNHFNNNACLTSKYGICKSLRSVMCPDGIDIDKFFPKAYDLSDLGDFQNFLQVFKWVFCESILKKYLYTSEEVPLDKVKVAIIVTQRRLTQLQNVLNSAINMKFCFCSFNQWKFIRDKPCNKESIDKKISKIFGDNLKGTVEGLLNKLKASEPQFELNGFKNIWIIKPAFLSRGRGIKCMKKLSQILDYSMGKQVQYVAQKYIENPLIINKRKFDIRIWILIEDYNPPKIWFFNEFYVRFCLQQYNTETLGNRYAHLTNNSIKKYNTKVGKADINASMWTREQFKNYINEEFGQGNFKTMVAKMKEIVIATVIGTVDQVQGKKGSFELLGYDMMIDDNLNPWLIEINTSPSMDYSCPITRKLVRMVMEDIAKVIVDERKRKNKKKVAGQFKCIYSGEPFTTKYYRIQSNQ